MRQLLKKITINSLGLLCIGSITGGINYQNNTLTLIIASICLMVLNLVIRPVLNLLFMPINLLTLGASRWLINIIILYSVTFFVDSFTIQPIKITTITISSFTYPGFDLSFFWSLVLISFLLEICISLFNWLLKWQCTTQYQWLFKLSALFS